MTLVAIVCRGCGAELGATDGARLLHGQIEMRRAVELRCCDCGTRRVWTPAPRASCAQKK